MTTPFRRLR